jgi:hypothetical protein
MGYRVSGYTSVKPIILSSSGVVFCWLVQILDEVKDSMAGTTFPLKQKSDENKGARPFYPFNPSPF